MSTHRTNSIFRASLVVTLSFALLACGGADDTASSVESHIERSKAYTKQGQYRAAAIEARNIIKKDRDNPAGYQLLAKTLFQAGSYKGVISALDSSPSSIDSDSLLLKAKAYAHIGKFNSAEKSLQEYETTPNHVSTLDAQILKAKIAAGKNQLAEAYTLINAVIANNPQNTEAENLLSQFYLKDNKVTEADNNITNTLNHNPENPEALFLSAHIAYQQNNLEKAEEQLTKALIGLPETDIIMPLRAATLRQLSKVLTEQGRTSEALIYSKLLAEANPESSEANSQLQKSLTLLQEGNIEEAELHLKELNKTYPSNDATAIYLGLINLQKGDFATADELFSGSIDTETANTKLIHAAVAAKLQLKKTNEALDILEQALTTHPNNPTLLKTYGLTALNSDTRQNKGVVALEKLIAMEPSDIALQAALVKYYLSNNKKEIATAKLNQLLKDFPTNPKVTELYSEAMQLQGEHEAATQAIDNLLAARNRDVEALNLAGRFALRNNKLTEATTLFKEALSKDSNNVNTLTMLGGIELQNKDTNQAEKTFLQLIAAAPNNPSGYKGLVNVYELNQEKNTIIPLLKSLVKQYDSQTATPGFVLAEYHIRHKQLEPARTLIEKYQPKINDNNYYREVASMMSYRLYQQAGQQQNWDEARAQLMKTIELSPNNEKLTAELINLETNQNNIAEAKRLIEQAKQQFPDSPIAVLAEANLLSKAQQKDQAITLLARAWAQNQDPRIISSLVNLNNDNAIEKARWLNEWIVKFPESPAPYMLSALDAQQAGQMDSAIKHYEKVVQLHPNNVAATNNLAWLYFERGNKEALAMANKAVALAPGSAAVLDTYGWIEVNMGDKQKGLTALKKASELAPNNTEIAEHLKLAKKQ